MMEAPVVLASDYDQTRFFKAADLKAEKKLRIKDVTEEMVGADKDKEKKLVVWFTNDEHGLVLNRVNNRTIREAYGDPVEGWTGKIVVIFPTVAEFRGKMGPAMRVRIPPPKQATAAPASPRPTPSGNSGNGAAATAEPAAPTEEDPDLQPDSAANKPIAEELDDEIPF
jgi:hypothetical protein